MVEPRRSARARGAAVARAGGPAVTGASSGDAEEADVGRRALSPRRRRRTRRSKSSGTETTNLDDAPCPSPSSTPSSPPPDFRDELPAMALLTLLYAIQGIPLGLTMGSVPFLLRDGAAAAAAAASESSSSTTSSALTAVGLFSTAAWPYAAKLAWSPVVDATTLAVPVPAAVYFAFETLREKVASLFFGEATTKTKTRKKNESSSISISTSSSPRSRSFFADSPRKSWIVPVQLLTSALLLSRGDAAASAVARGDAPAATAFFFALVLLAATQDIAVDGWALTLLSRERVGWASTCQTIGTNLGFFASFTALMALGDSAFCDRWIHSLRKTRGGTVAPTTTSLFTRLSSFFFSKKAAATTTGGGALWSLRGYLRFWGWAYLAVTVFVAVFVPEKKEKKKESTDESEGDDDDIFSEISDAYRRLRGIASLSSIKRLCLLLLTCRLAILPAEAAAALALSAKGVPRESLAGLVLVQLPAEALAAFLAGRAGAGGGGDTGRGGSGGASRAWVRGYWLRLFAALATTALVVSQPATCAPLSPPKSSCLSPLRFSLLALAGLLTAFSATLQFTCMGAVFSTISDAEMGGTYLTLLNTVANLGITVPRGAVLAAVDGLGLGAVSVVSVALGAVAGVLWYSEELPRLEALPTESWRAAVAVEAKEDVEEKKRKKKRE